MDAWNRLRVPLPQTARIDGLQLAAGTMVRWNKDQKGHLLTAELGTGQEVSPGMVLVGEVDHVVEEFWRGTLARRSVLRGWTCSAGKVDIHTSGELRWCVLADPRKTEAGVVPAGTAVLLGPGEPSDAQLHLPKVGMRANPGSSGLHPMNGLSCMQTGNCTLCPDRSLCGESRLNRELCCATVTKMSRVGMAAILFQPLRRLHAHLGR
jgi:hypothetical protein